MGNKSNRSRRKKRRFHGRRKSEIQDDVSANDHAALEVPTPYKPGTSEDVHYISSSSRRKIIELNKTESTNVIENDDCNPSICGFLLIHSSVLRNIVNILCCPCCCSEGLDIHSNGKKSGFAIYFDIVCKQCGWEENVVSSPTVEKKERKQGSKPFEVNRRMVMAFRGFGKGLNAMRTFCTYMNMREPMETKNYNDFIVQLRDAFVSEADESMARAASTVRSKNSECAVSVDGTWQRRGHLSLNGVVTVISTDTGQCLDYAIKCKKCKSCEVWQKRDKSSEQYREWEANHNCSVNHHGSSGSMESAGAVEIFNRSVVKHNLQYTSYIGDDDSSAFKRVFESNPYPGKKIVKKECVGHIQKRVGSRLRQKLKDYRGKKLSDGKCLSGSKGRLTDTMMNRLQNYYGIAIRQNKGNLDGMVKAASAVLYHCGSTTENPQHDNCSAEWCNFIKNPETYKHKGSGLDKAVIDVIKPVFTDLSNKELLSRCIDAYTQNPNESLNSMIWKRCSKEVYCGRNLIEIAVANAVSSFNDGDGCIANVLRKLNIEPGHNTEKLIASTNLKRIHSADFAASEKAKKRRKTLRAIKKGYTDKEREDEGEEYGAGMF